MKKQTNPAVPETAGKVKKTTTIDSWVSLINFVSFWHIKYYINL